MDCAEYIERRVKLGYVADNPTAIQLVDSIGNQVFDLLPVIQAGETDTSIELLTDLKRIRYYPEKWTRTEGRDGCYYDICISDIANLINLNDLGNVEDGTLASGDIVMYNATTQMYEIFNLTEALNNIGGDISSLLQRIVNLEGDVTTLNNKIIEQNQKIAQLTELVATFNQRISDIENAIYNWSSDKNTKIPRGNINVTSGGYNSGNGIYTRVTNTDEDLNFN